MQVVAPEKQKLLKYYLMLKINILNKVFMKFQEYAHNQIKLHNKFMVKLYIVH